VTAPSEHRLAAIMFTDIVGYTALMAESEARGHRVRARQREILKPLVERYGGDWIQHTGDEVLASFPSAVTAANCALAIQAALRDEPDLRLRIGLHVGDVVAREGGLHGDGVNITARIRPLAEPGGVCVSDEVVHAIRNQDNLRTTPLGSHDLKNVGRPVSVYALEGEAASPAAGTKRARARPLALAALGSVLIAIAAAAYLTFGRSPSKETGAPLTSIAVLPFDDMSPGGDQKWLADGMAEELIETLSRIEALRVPARTSAFAMKGRDIATVGAELRVGSVVEGSVRRSDDQLRVTAQLIRVSDGSHLWSARYDRKLADVFAIQSEIARAIAEAIRRELGIEYEVSWFQSHEPSDVRAYELYKTGYHLMWPHLTEEGIRKGIEYFEQALALDPDYAQAHVELGFAYLFRFWLYARPDTDLELAKQEADRVLAADATNGGAYNLLGWILERRHQWKEAERVVRLGLSQNPAHSSLLSQSAGLLALQGRPEEALVAARRAVDLEPRFALFQIGLGTMEVLAGEFDAAALDLERAWKLAPGSSSTRAWLGYAYHMSGRDAEALEAAARELPPELSALESAMRQGFEAGGFRGAMRARHEWLVARSRAPCSDDTSLLWGGDPLATLGEGDSVFECLEQAIDRGNLLYLRANPVYDPYRSDPRFAALLRRMNLGE
jgi:TolB-like protein/class 3 adenylate cyclase/Flp pilus assembly protein TadD